MQTLHRTVKSFITVKEMLYDSRGNVKLISHNVKLFNYVHTHTRQMAYSSPPPTGSMTSIFQVFLGLQAGMILQAHKSHHGRVGRWMAWSLMLGAVGAGLCGASMNDGVIPVNKNLW